MIRTLTLVISLDDEDKPNWIWESHKNQKFHHKVQVDIIAEGNQIRNDNDFEED